MPSPFPGMDPFLEAQTWPDFHVRQAEIYPWRLRDPMPAIPIPLKREDGEVTLNLQEVFDTVYERAGYDYSIHYDRLADLRFEEADQRWAKELLLAANLAQS